jgi:phosphatidylserine/phosphatidylglycerophosphate/cardiolipin synthase-like enzyme
MGEAGLAPHHLAALLSCVAEERAAAEKARDAVDLVVTGPDASAGARDTFVVMRDLFASVQRSILAVGFAVHDGRQVFADLAARLDAVPSIEATLCLDVSRKPGDSSLEAEVVARFAEHFVRHEWPGKRLPRIYYDPRSLRPAPDERSSLHAKCIIADETQALVTSANFTEAAQHRNIEVGLMVRQATVARAIAAHFAGLIQRGVLVRLPLPSLK